MWGAKGRCNGAVITPLHAPEVLRDLASGLDVASQVAGPGEEERE